MLSVRKCMVAGALAVFFTTAGAQQGACKEDVEKLCKDVQPGEGKSWRASSRTSRRCRPSARATSSRFRSR